MNIFCLSFRRLVVTSKAVWRYLGVVAFLWIGVPWLAAQQTEAWKITSIDGRDYVSLENIAQFYSLGSEILPAENRIDFITEHADLQFYKDSREVQINGVRHWLGFTPVQHENSLLISKLDLVKTIEPVLRPNAIPTMRPVQTVILDPGHGGHDLGATTELGNEKDFSLEICKQAAQILKNKGFEVVFTRDKDVFVSLEERASIANRYRNAIFISVHFNDSAENPEANGLEIFALTPRGMPSTADEALLTQHMKAFTGNQNDSLNIVFATTLQHAVLGNMPQFDRGVKRARFAVLKLVTMPAVLVEGAFLSNDNDRQLAANPAWRELLAESIVAGIVDYRKLTQTRQSPKMVADYRMTPLNTGASLESSAKLGTWKDIAE